MLRIPHNAAQELFSKKARKEIAPCCVVANQNRDRRSVNRGQNYQIAHIAISYLALSVIKANLEELFAQYRPTRISLLHNKHGRSLLEPRTSSSHAWNPRISSLISVESL